MTSAIPHQAIYRRWRAQTFGEIVGQEAVVETLRNAVRTSRVAHAILFVGPRGTGKTSLARILAKAVNCTNLQDGDACDACPSCVAIREGTTLDLIEIDAASNRGIDEARNLRERLAYPPAQLKRKVYILDEAHQITGPAWNALLKSIEEPPDFVVFMFASTEPSLFPPAILSRLQRFDVRRLTVPEIEGKLRKILAADGREADEAAIHLIARIAAGGMRDAEAMLDQLLSAAPERIEEAQVRDLLGLADAEAVNEFIDVLVRGDPAAGVALLDALDDRGRDVRALLDQVVEQIRTELVAGLADPSKARHDPAALAAAGRRLAAIDPARAGIGGVRFQLELALFAGVGETSRVATARTEAPAVKHAVRPAQTKVVEEPAPKAVEAASEPAPPSAPTVVARPPEPARATPTAPGSASEAAAAATSASASKATPRAPAEVQASGSAAASGASNSTAALEELLASWPAIVAQLSGHPPTKPLINACRPVSVEGATVTLGFPEEQAFLKDAAERRRSAIEAGIGAVLGRPVAVRCVVANIEVSGATADASFVLAEARRIFADDIVDVGEVS